MRLFRWSELELDAVQDGFEDSDNDEPGGSGGREDERIVTKRRLESEDGPYPTVRTE